MSDILTTMYYGIGLISVISEACTSRLPVSGRRVILYGTVMLCLFRFSQLSLLAYGSRAWDRAQCEASGIDIDCIRFPPSPAELADMIENSGQTTDSTQLTIYVDLAGSSQPFRYTQGQEGEADKHIAILKQASFNKEAQAATGALRYHRVLPTPGITPEEAAMWSNQVLVDASNRQNMERARLEQEAKEAAEKAKEAPKRRRKADDKFVDGGPIMGNVYEEEEEVVNDTPQQNQEIPPQQANEIPQFYEIIHPQQPNDIPQQVVHEVPQQVN